MEEKNRASDSASGTGNWKPCPSLAGKRLIHMVLKTNATRLHHLQKKSRAQGAGTTKPEIFKKENHTYKKNPKNPKHHLQTSFY